VPPSALFLDRTEPAAGKFQHPVRSAFKPPDSSTFLSERTSHQQPAATSQQYSSLRTNQHQPSATSQPNRLSRVPKLGIGMVPWKRRHARINAQSRARCGVGTPRQRSLSIRGPTPTHASAVPRSTRIGQRSSSTNSVDTIDDPSGRPGPLLSYSSSPRGTPRRARRDHYLIRSMQ
jgi:hypothetical protein